MLPLFYCPGKEFKMPDEQTEQVQDTPVESPDGEDQQESSEVQEDSGDVKFSKAQLQQISSIMGDMIKRGIEKNVNPIIEQLQAQNANPYQDTGKSSTAKQQFNERLQEMIFSGQVMEAVEEIERVRSAAHKNLSQTNKNRLSKEMAAYEEKPLFNSLKKEVLGEASVLIENNWPPAAAVAMAWEKAEKTHYQKKLSGDSDESSLEMTSGGRRSVPKGKIKLPPQYEAAYQRDKAKGYFKTREEYVDSLSPIVRGGLGF